MKAAIAFVSLLLIMANSAFASIPCSGNLTVTSFTASNVILLYGYTETATVNYSGGTPPYLVGFFISNQSRSTQYLANTGCYFTGVTAKSERCTFLFNNISFSGVSELGVDLVDSSKPLNLICQPEIAVSISNPASTIPTTTRPTSITTTVSTLNTTTTVLAVIPPHQTTVGKNTYCSFYAYLQNCTVGTTTIQFVGSYNYSGTTGYDLVLLDHGAYVPVCVNCNSSLSNYVNISGRILNITFQGGSASTQFVSIIASPYTRQIPSNSSGGSSSTSLSSTSTYSTTTVLPKSRTTVPQSSGSSNSIQNIINSIIQFISSLLKKL